MSQPLPTVHPLMEHTNSAKANIESIVFWGPGPHQLTPVRCRQQVGWFSLQLLRALPHMFSQPLPQAHWLCCEKHKGWRRLAGREQPLQIQIHRHGAGMEQSPSFPLFEFDSYRLHARNINAKRESLLKRPSSVFNSLLSS